MDPTDAPPSTSRSARGQGPVTPGPPSDLPPVKSRPPPPASSPRVGVIVALLLIVPLLVLVLAIALVPAFRPWALPLPAAEPASGRVAAVTDSSDSAEISGRVVDEEGEEVEGAKVTLLGPAPIYAHLRDFTTDRDGVFVFTDLRPGGVLVVAEHDSGVVASADLTVALGTKIQDLVLALDRARIVRGAVTDEDGKPVRGAVVSTEDPAWAKRSGTAADDGGYKLERVPRGARLVHVLARNYAPAVARLAPDVSGADEIVNVRLKKEADVDGIVFDDTGAAVRATVLACDGKDADHRTISGADGRFHFPRELAACPMVAVHDKFAPSDPIAPSGDTVTLRLKAGGGISGSVWDESGAAVPAFFIGIESFTPSYGDREFSVRSGGTTNFADENGAFSLDKLAPGSYVLSAGTEGRAPVRSSSIDVSAGRVTRDVRIVLTRGGAVEGQVFDDEKRSAIGGARVTFDSTTSTRGDAGSAATDATGHYRLENAPLGPFSLRIEADGYRSRILSGLKVDPKALAKVDVALKADVDGGAKLEFGGVGALLGQTREGIAFTGVFEGAPAAKAGVQQGDLLRKIDGQSAEGMSVSDAIQRLRGEEGSVVKVTVERAGQSFDFAITRAVISR